MDDPKHLDRLFSALADPTRRSLLERLAQGPASVGTLAEPVPLSLAAVSKHLKSLEAAGLIRRSIERRSHICHLVPEGVTPALCWSQRLTGTGPGTDPVPDDTAPVPGDDTAPVPGDRS